MQCAGRMDFDSLVHLLVRAVEAAGIAVLLLGMLFSIYAFVRDWARGDLGEAYAGCRANLGRSILLGLEFLVVADIIATVAMEPTFHNLGVLALLVGVRTFLSFALEVEISGRWPWRRVEDTSPHQLPSER